MYTVSKITNTDADDGPKLNNVIQSTTEVFDN